MRAYVEERLKSLKAEFKTGQDMLASLETNIASTRNTLMRISGAIQVLEELLESHPSSIEEPAGMDASREPVLAP